jgi:NADH:ubiquinone oxidoreductase subunit E
MVTVTVCVGSSCHLKGAREVIVRFSELLKEHGLTDRVALKGSFCMERCGEGVNWQVDDEPFTSATQADAVETFRQKVLEPMATNAADRRGGSASS